MKLVFLGPPGVGKGTHADIISKDLGITHYSTGDIFREILKESSPLSDKLEKYVNSGELVPDEIVFETVKEVLVNCENENGWLLDGYPRNRNQAELLDDYLERIGVELDWAIYLYADTEVLIKRLTNRRVCPNCGAIYNLVNSPPKKEGVCDKCGSDLIQREDDNEETIKRRITIFEKEFKPLKEYYKDKGLLLEILSEGGLKNISDRIKEGLKVG
jgi:adenylate kinase